MKKLEELRELSARAERGDWEFDPHDQRIVIVTVDGNVVRVADRVSTRDGEFIVACVKYARILFQSIPGDIMSVSDGLPAVRIVDPSTSDDTRFWRDVEAAQRVATPGARNRFISELAQVEASRRMEGFPATERNKQRLAEIESDLIRDCRARGYCD